MLRRDEFQTKRIIGFEYRKKKTKNGYRWHLVDQILDAGVIKIIGSENFRTPAVTKRPPQYLLRKLYRALGKHHLDGGEVEELPSAGETYGVMIAIKERCPKPNQ